MDFRQWLEGMEDWDEVPKPRSQVHALINWGRSNYKAIAGKRVHMGNDGVEGRDVPQTVQPGYYRMNNKPFGLWYAWGTDWIQFVVSEHTSATAPVIYEVEINPSRILILDNPKVSAEVEQKYGIWKDLEKHGYSSPYGDVHRVSHGDGKGNYTTTTHPRLLDWERMRADYDGIEVDVNKVYIPWIDHRDWSINSGCNWSKAGVRTVKPIARYDPKTYRYVSM